MSIKINELEIYEDDLNGSFCLIVISGVTYKIDIFLLYPSLST